VRFDYIKFIRDHHPPLRSVEVEEAIHTEVAKIADDIRHKIRRKYNRKELRKPFRHFARRRGEAGASLEDLKLGLYDLGIDLSDIKLRALFQLINGGVSSNSSSSGSGNNGNHNNTQNTYKDSNGNSIFRYSEFVIFVCDGYNTDVTLKHKYYKFRISENRITITIFIRILCVIMITIVTTTTTTTITTNTTINQLK
jgi:hypothetical protein